MSKPPLFPQTLNPKPHRRSAGPVCASGSVSTWAGPLYDEERPYYEQRFSSASACTTVYVYVPMKTGRVGERVGCGRSLGRDTSDGGMGSLVVEEVGLEDKECEI
jgi:hypothetical protein